MGCNHCTTCTHGYKPPCTPRPCLVHSRNEHPGHYGGQAIIAGVMMRGANTFAMHPRQTAQVTSRTAAGLWQGHRASDRFHPVSGAVTDAGHNIRQRLHDAEIACRKVKKILLDRTRARGGDCSTQARVVGTAAYRSRQPSAKGLHILEGQDCQGTEKPIGCRDRQILGSAPSGVHDRADRGNQIHASQSAQARLARDRLRGHQRLQGQWPDGHALQRPSVQQVRGGSRHDRAQPWSPGSLLSHDQAEQP